MNTCTARKPGWAGAVLSVLILSSFACSLGGASGAKATSAPGQGGAESSASPTPPSQSAASGSCGNPLYPVGQGASWSYKTTSTLGGSEYTKTVTEVRKDGFTIDEVFTNGTKTTREWGCAADGLTALTPDSGSSASVTSGETKTTIKSTSVKGVTLPLKISAGDSWTQTIDAKGTIHSSGGPSADTEVVTTQSFTAVAMENVTLPAGTFDAVKMKVHTDIRFIRAIQGQDVSSDITSDNTLWYAPDVGEVKSTGTLPGGLSGSVELTSYKLP